MSAPEPGLRLSEVSAGIVELCALRGRTPQLMARAAECGLPLPAFGRSAASAPAARAAALALCVRPDRWLVLFDDDAGWTGAAAGAGAVAGAGAAIDLSCGLAALHLSGSAVCEMLARGCRLDLDPAVFPVGTAAATQMAQVSVILASRPSGMLLLTPATTARHFREWLISTAQPFGLGQCPARGVGDL